MGASPKSSVVDPEGQCWECSGLYLADASVFPTASGQGTFPSEPMSVLSFLRQHQEESQHEMATMPACNIRCLLLSVLWTASLRADSYEWAALNILICSYAGVNPMITTYAISHMIATGIAKKLKKGTVVWLLTSLQQKSLSTLGTPHHELPFMHEATCIAPIKVSLVIIPRTDIMVETLMNEASAHDCHPLLPAKM